MVTVTVIGYQNIATDHTDSWRELPCCLSCYPVSHNDLLTAGPLLCSQGLRNGLGPSWMFTSFCRFSAYETKEHMAPWAFALGEMRVESDVCGKIEQRKWGRNKPRRQTTKQKATQKRSGGYRTVRLLLLLLLRTTDFRSRIFCHSRIL